MKYTPKQYARAFAGLVTVGDVGERELVRNFTFAIERNGDMPQREKIFQETDRELRRAYGKRTVVLETARPLEKLQNKFKNFITKDDVVEERLDPELVAGIRITIDDEDQYDGSLARKLQTLFKEV